LGAATAAGWATYRREAFLEPEFSGSLEVAVELLGPIRRASGRLAEFRSEIERLAENLPLPQLQLPFLFESELGPAEVDVLARAVLDSIDALEHSL
jgi:hypothetical protein